MAIDRNKLTTEKLVWFIDPVSQTVEQGRIQAVDETGIYFGYDVYVRFVDVYTSWATCNKDCPIRVVA